MGDETVIDTPQQILADLLMMRGKTIEQAREITDGLYDPMDILDMAEWLLNHKDASRQEMLKEQRRLQLKHSI